jgi:hypothetical protein
MNQEQAIQLALVVFVAAAFVFVNWYWSLD